MIWAGSFPIFWAYKNSGGLRELWRKDWSLPVALHPHAWFLARGCPLLPLSRYMGAHSSWWLHKGFPMLPAGSGQSLRLRGSRACSCWCPGLWDPHTPIPFQGLPQSGLAFHRPAEPETFLFLVLRNPGDWIVHQPPKPCLSVPFPSFIHPSLILNLGLGLGKPKAA